MSRDFLDFFVEYLPTAVNELAPQQREVAKHLALTLRKTAKEIEKSVLTDISTKEARLSSTVGILIFNGDFSRKVSSKMKEHFFEASFWSLYRYYRHIVVMTKSTEDMQTVQKMKLPVSRIYNFNIILQSDRDQAGGYSHTTTNSARDVMQGMLTKHALEQTLITWDEDPTWANFKYAMILNADQILHGRRFADLYNLLDIPGTDGQVVLVPHRMPTMPIAQNFPVEIQQSQWFFRPKVSDEAQTETKLEMRDGLFRDWSKSGDAKGLRSLEAEVSPDEAFDVPEVKRGAPPVNINKGTWLPHANIFTEKLGEIQGSCCESGRFVFPKCSRQTGKNSRVTDYIPSSSSGSTHGRMLFEDSFEPVEPSLERIKSRFAGRTIQAPGNNLAGDVVRRGSKGGAGLGASASWTSCTEWGARNFTSWLKVGPDGFVFPPVTANLAYCTYSKTAKTCPLPAMRRRSEFKNAKNVRSASSGVCSPACTDGKAVRVPALKHNKRGRLSATTTEWSPDTDTQKRSNSRQSEATSEWRRESETPNVPRHQQGSGGGHHKNRHSRQRAREEELSSSGFAVCGETPQMRFNVAMTPLLSAKDKLLLQSVFGTASCALDDDPNALAAASVGLGGSEEHPDIAAGAQDG